MEHLSQHIVYLLSRHDCVILPGIGAFIVTRHVAKYNAASGRWLPPTRHISFNSAVRSDDGLLAHSYARRLHVDFEQARKEVDLAVSRLLSTLKENKSIAFENLGTLHTEEDDRIVFTPAVTPERRFEELGYQSFSIAAPVSPRKDRLFSRLRRKALRVAAVCAAVAVGAASLLIPRAIGHDTQLASVVPVPVKNVATSYTALTPKVGTTDSAQVITKDTLSTRVPSESVAIPAGQAPKYHLIVATFHTSKEAEIYIDSKNNSHDTDSLYAVAGHKVTRVAAASSDNRQELLTIMRNSSFSSCYPDCWIWTDK